MRRKGETMGLRRRYLLICDECGVRHKTSAMLWYDTPRRARAAAKRDGWIRHQKSWDWWVDLCPVCADEPEQDAPEGGQDEQLATR